MRAAYVHNFTVQVYIKSGLLVYINIIMIIYLFLLKREDDILTLHTHNQLKGLINNT